MEIWKEVVGYEGLYEVSNYGRVLSLPRLKYGRTSKDGQQTVYRTKKKLLSPKVDKDGYLSVTLTDPDGNRAMRRVHRIVAIAFIDKPEGKDVVHHKDENVKNNSVHNLAWVTNKENLSASDVFGKLAKIHGVPIVQKDTDGNVLAYFPSCQEAARQLGLDVRHINAVVTGKRKRHKGFVFEEVVE